MTKLLLKLFVKNHDNAADPTVRARIGKLSGIVGILANAVLCAGKLFIGTVSVELKLYGEGLVTFTAKLDDAANTTWDFQVDFTSDDDLGL